MGRAAAPFAWGGAARGNDKGALVTVPSGTSVSSLCRIEQDDPLRVVVYVPQPAYPAITTCQALDFYPPITYEKVQHQTQSLAASPTRHPPKRGSATPRVGMNYYR